MAYRFKLDESFQDGLVRIGTEQMRRARSQLEGGASPKAVHETRKAIKRLRALLQLVRPAIPRAKFTRENKRLRDIARTMSGARDATVVRDLLVRLTADAAPQDKALLSQVTGALTSNDSRDADEPGHGANIERSIAEAERGWRRLRLDDDGFDSIGRGLGRTYRQCAKAAATAWGDHADATSEDLAFHECRKAVQRHWRHMRLLSPAWPDALAAREELAHEVSEILGEAQDIAVLIAHVDRLEQRGKLHAGSAKRLRKIARRRQRSLRAAARPRLERLTAESARSHVRRIESYWLSAAGIAAHPFDQHEPPASEADGVSPEIAEPVADRIAAARRTSRKTGGGVSKPMRH